MRLMPAATSLLRHAIRTSLRLTELAWPNANVEQGLLFLQGSDEWHCSLLATSQNLICCLEGVMLAALLYSGASKLNTGLQSFHMMLVGLNLAFDSLQFAGKICELLLNRCNVFLCDRI
jgi:hypothetical protein